MFRHPSSRKTRHPALLSTASPYPRLPFPILACGLLRLHFDTQQRTCHVAIGSDRPRITRLPLPTLNSISHRGHGNPQLRPLPRSQSFTISSSFFPLHQVSAPTPLLGGFRHRLARFWAEGLCPSSASRGYRLRAALWLGLLRPWPMAASAVGQAAVASQCTVGEALPPERDVPATASRAG